MLKPFVDSGSFFSSFRSMVSEIHALNFEDYYQTYLSLQAKKQDGAGKGSQINRLTNFFAQKIPEHFSKQFDVENYNDFVPHAKYFEEVYKKDHKRARGYMDQMMDLVKATIISGDHSFKVPKHLMCIKGIKIFNALYTVVNNLTTEIVHQRFCISKSSDEVIDVLNDVAERIRKNGYEEVEFFLTDNKTDYPLLSECFPSLKKDIVRPTYTDNYLSIQMFCGLDLILTIDERNIETFCNMFTEQYLTDKFIVGLDIEHDVPFVSVDTLQLCYKDKEEVFGAFFHLSSMKQPILRHVLDLLENKNIFFTGVNIMQDCVKLEKSFNISLNRKEKCFELAQLAKSKGLIRIAKITLNKLCKILYGKDLNKSDDLRTSNWSDKDSISSDKK
eukprot:Awhi_evm1s10160